jgi:hypothetical protein
MKNFIRDTLETAIHGQPRYLDVDRLPFTSVNQAEGSRILIYLQKIGWEPDFNYKKGKENV